MNNLIETDYPEPEFQGNPEFGIDGNKYYQKVLVEGQIVSINDSVLVLTDWCPPECNEFTFCGRILQLWETKDNKKMAQIHWYWRKLEIPEDVRQYLLERELLISEKTDPIFVDAIKGKIKVYESSELLGNLVNKSPDPLTNEFFCTRGIIVSKWELVALSTIHRLIKLATFLIEKADSGSKIDLARARLQLNNTQSVAGRKTEMELISNTLKRSLNQKGRGSTLYISGVPGSGKTLCVREVIRRLVQEQLDDSIPSFEYYEINCLRFESPKEIYGEMWYVLSGERLGDFSAQKALNEIFNFDPPSQYIVLLVDEIDVMVTPQQNELFCLFEWASLPKSHLIIVCIANLMDLESRLKPKLASRFGSNSVKFYAYKHEDLVEILHSRIEDVDLFEPKSIELCSRKVSLIGGDARKALETCKRALDLLSNDNELKVTVEMMQNTLKELQSVRAMDLIDKLSENQKLFLVSLISESHLTSRTLIPIRDVIDRFKLYQLQLNLKNFLQSQMILIIANTLFKIKMISISNSDPNISINSQISLLVQNNDILIPLKKDSKLNKFINFSEKNKKFFFFFFFLMVVRIVLNSQ